MDKKQKKKIKKLEAEATDVLGSGLMVTIKGQPFLDAQGEKLYLDHETLDEESKDAKEEKEEQRKSVDKTQS